MTDNLHAAVEAVEALTSRFQQTPLPDGTLTGNACHVAVNNLYSARQNGSITKETGRIALDKLVVQVKKHSAPLAERLEYIFSHGASGFELNGSTGSKSSYIFTDDQVDRLTASIVSGGNTSSA